MSKSFKEYLSESITAHKHEFRVKVAGTFTTDQENKLKSSLGRYQVDTFKKVGVTPIQSVPLDFPQVRNCEVSIFEVVLEYPTTQQELTEYLTTELGVSKQHLVVRRPGEPSEEYQTIVEPREGALLDDSNYKEAGSPNFDDYYGTKYNSGFVKELNDILKLQRKERGEVIPTEGVAKFLTDLPGNDKINLSQAPDPRKK
jgi:hypothetical protein